MGGKKKKAKKSEGSPVDQLIAMGVEFSEDGGIRLPKEVIQRVREERVRQAALSQVPGMPTFTQREGGGVGVNKGHSRHETLSVEALRRVRERSTILGPIHSARAHQVRRMSRRWSGKRTDVGWRVHHKDHAEATADPPKGFKKYIQRVENMLERPSPRYAKTTADLLVPLEEDLLCINRPVIEKLYSRFDDNRVIGLRPVDGAIIWPTMIFLEQWAAKNPAWASTPSAPRKFDADAPEDVEAVYADILAIEGFDLSGAEYCCIRDGNLEAIYRPGDLIVYPFQNRTDIAHAGWPPSHVEEAIEIILTSMNTWDYNASFFTRGMVSDFIIAVSGGFHEEDLAEFRDTFREATMGVSRAWRPPIMPFPEDGSIEKIDLKATNTEMGYETFQSLQIALACGVYRMHPSTINAKPWDGGSGPSLSAPGQSREIALAQEEGLRCDLDHHADALTEFAAHCHPDLRVSLYWGPEDEDREARIHDVRCNVAMTRNEVRLEMGYKPMGFWVPPEEYDDINDEDRQKYESNLWNQPKDPTFVNQYAMAQQEQGQEEQGPPDGFGGMGGEQAQGDFGEQEPSYPYGQEAEDGQPPPPPPPPGGAQAEPMQKGRPRITRITVYEER